MSVSSSAQATERDLVFCHNCENEWFRDQHGLQCPRCASDVVEIIEAEHDPRSEMHGQEGDNRNASPGGNVFGTGIGGLYVPDPDDGDISAYDRSRSRSPLSGSGYEDRPPFPHPDGSQAPVQALFQNFLSQLSNAYANPRDSRSEVPPMPHTPLSEPPVPDDRLPLGHTVHVSGGPTVTQRRFQFGPFRGTFTSSSAHYVNGQLVRSTSSHPLMGGSGEGAAGPDPFSHDPDFAGIFGNFLRPPHMPPHTPPHGLGTGSGHGTPSEDARFPAGGAAMAGSPFNAILASLGMMTMDGRHGDYVYSQEALDRIMTDLQANQQSTAPGPASAEAIKALPLIKLTHEMLGDEKVESADCGICLSECKVGETVAELPCKHWFHFECVKIWLEAHDSCPTCRRGILPREGAENRPRATGEAPRHWQMPAPSGTDTHGSNGGPNSEPNTSWHGSLPLRPVRSTSPVRTPPASQAAHSGGRTVGAMGSLADSFRNGISNWMGRHQAGSGSTSSNGPPAQDSSTSGGSGRESIFRRDHRSSNRNNRTAGHNGLDNPEVD